MKRYIIQVASSGKDCFIANCEGDPGRTLERLCAKAFRNKSLAKKEKRRLDKYYPNREFKVIEL